MKKIVFITGLLLSCLGASAQNIYWDESIFCKTGILPISDMPSINWLFLDEEGKVTSIAFKFYDNDQGCYLERRLPNGRLDVSFGVNGRTFVPLEVRAYGGAWAAVRPDGKILINVNFRSVATPEIPSKLQTVVMCFDTNGLLDDAFGENGTLDLDFWGFIVPVFAAPSNDYFFRVDTNDPALRLICKHNNDGTLDDRFGEEGQVSFSNFTFRKYGAILSLKDGSLLCGGAGRRILEDNSKTSEFGVMKLNADGTVYSGFGENGLASFDFAEDPVYIIDYASFDCCMHLVELEDGSILASGTTADRTHNVLLKLHADGTLDTGFGNNGFVLYEYQEGHEMQTDRSTGDIIIGGRPGDPFQSTEYSYVITRFDKNGTTLFSEGFTGVTLCMALREDGRMWLGGSMGGSTALGRITFNDNFGSAEDDCNIGLDKTVTDNLEIYPWDNGIVLTGVAQGEVITVYNAAGVVVATAVADDGETHIPLPGKGIYIVKAIGKATKVVL